MAYPIDRKLVIGVAPSALFDLTESHQIYLNQGVDKYRIHQEKKIDNPFSKGVAFPFIRRFLGIGFPLKPGQNKVKPFVVSEVSPRVRGKALSRNRRCLRQFFVFL